MRDGSRTWSRLGVPHNTGSEVFYDADPKAVLSAAAAVAAAAAAAAGVQVLT